MDKEQLEEAIEQEAQRAYAQHKGRERARRRIAREENKSTKPLQVVTLREALAMGKQEYRYRVEGLLFCDGNTIISAQLKTGKTTYMMNASRALIEGGEFLGRRVNHPIGADRTVAILSYEMNLSELARWADLVGVPRDRLVIINLRNEVNPLATSRGQDRVVEALKNARAQVVFIDSMVKAHTSESENDADGMSAFLADLDILLRGRAGVEDIIVLAHEGWQGGHTRGSSAVEAWADTIVRLRKKGERGSAPRIMSANGRMDEEVEDVALIFDPETKRLSVGEAVSMSARDRVIEALREGGVLGRDDLIKRTGLHKSTVSEITKTLAHEGVIEHDSNRLRAWRLQESD